MTVAVSPPVPPVSLIVVVPWVRAARARSRRAHGQVDDVGVVGAVAVEHGRARPVSHGERVRAVSAGQDRLLEDAPERLGLGVDRQGGVGELEVGIAQVSTIRSTPPSSRNESTPPPPVTVGFPRPPSRTSGPFEPDEPVVVRTALESQSHMVGDPVGGLERVVSGAAVDGEPIVSGHGAEDPEKRPEPVHRQGPGARIQAVLRAHEDAVGPVAGVQLHAVGRGVGVRQRRRRRC